VIVAYSTKDIERLCAEERCAKKQLGAEAARDVVSTQVPDAKPTADWVLDAVSAALT
jgi:hypothetical protein